MSAPALIYLTLMMFVLGVSLARHGQPQPNSSFWSSLLRVAIALSLLYWGGFFEPHP